MNKEAVHHALAPAVVELLAMPTMNMLVDPEDLEEVLWA